jgi:hypothetical protein
MFHTKVIEVSSQESEKIKILIFFSPIHDFFILKTKKTEKG